MLTSVSGEPALVERHGILACKYLAAIREPGVGGSRSE